MADFKRVLVIDDELVVQHLLCQQLRCFGIEQARATGSGSEGLEVVRSWLPDLVVCDLRLPDIDGPQLIRALSELGYSGGVLIISASDARILHTVELLTEELGLNLVGSLVKPVNPYKMQWLLEQASHNAAQVDEQDGKKKRQVIDRAMIEAGLSRNAVVPFYQPKWDPIKKQVMGFEVLARWADDDGHLLSPGAFIPVIEQSGYLSSFTMQLLDRVLSDSKSLLAVDENLHFAVNFGIETLQDRHLPDELLARLTAHNMRPDSLTIEITETGLSNDLPDVLEVVARLHLLGFKLSIDDFGTGYSTFTRAKGLPFTELKVDRAFVMDADSNDSSRAIISSSIALARDLNMQVIAEGVERAETLALMQEMGCDLIQGFHIGRPASVADTLQFMTAQSSAVHPS